MKKRKTTPPERGGGSSDRPRRPTLGEGTIELRKLQRMGPVTLGVSLPRRWVDARGLAAGQPVELAIRPDGRLVLEGEATGPPVKPKVLEINAPGSPDQLFRELVAGYLSGANKFVVRPTGEAASFVPSVVRQFVERTTGPEIVRENEREIVLRDVYDPESIPVSDLLRRMGQLVAELHRRSRKAYTSAGGEPLGRWVAWDDEVDRQAWLIERLLAREASQADNWRLDRSAYLRNLLSARALERIADHGVRIGLAGEPVAGRLIRSGRGRAISELHRQTIELLRSAVALSLRPSVEEAETAIDQTEALHATAAALIGGLESPGARRAPGEGLSERALLESIDRTIAYVQDLAEVALDDSVAERIWKPSPRLSSHRSVPTPPLTAGGPATTA